MEQIKIDIVPVGVTPVAHASQFDNGRQIRFNLFNQGTPYTLTGAETVTMVVNGEEENITNTSDNYVIWDVAEEDCAEVGVIGCEIRIVLGSMLIGSKNFFLEVEMDPYDGKNVRTVTVGPADICTFETTLPEPLQSVIVDIEATGGNGTPDSPIPINGYTEANITRCGVNLLHVNSRVDATVAQVHYTSDDNYIYMNGTKSGGGYANLTDLTITLPAGTYYLKAFAISGTASNIVELYAYDGSSNLTGNLFASERTLTLTELSTFHFRFAVWVDETVLTDYKVGIVITTASGISAFTPYNGTTYAVSWQDEAGTVYGGVLDVTRGKLVVTYEKTKLSDLTFVNSGNKFYTRAFADAPTGATYTNNFLCSIFTPVNKDWNQLLNGECCLRASMDVLNKWSFVFCSDDYATVADFLAILTDESAITYELATPIEIDLTPEVISAVVGEENNVFADCGQSTVKFLKAGG